MSQKQVSFKFHGIPQEKATLASQLLSKIFIPRKIYPQNVLHNFTRDLISDLLKEIVQRKEKFS